MYIYHIIMKSLNFWYKLNQWIIQIFQFRIHSIELILSELISFMDIHVQWNLSNLRIKKYSSYQVLELSKSLAKNVFYYQPFLLCYYFLYDISISILPFHFKFDYTYTFSVEGPEKNTISWFKSIESSSWCLNFFCIW